MLYNCHYAYFFHSILIISSLLAGNTRAADNCLNVKDISDKYGVNQYTNPYYNDKDGNVYYSFNISLPEALDFSDKSHIAIQYSRSNPFGYDVILVIVFADCPHPVWKCGNLNFGIYTGEYREWYEMEKTAIFNPSNGLVITKYYLINSTDTRFIAHHEGPRDGKTYKASFNVFIIPSVMNKTDADKFKDHFCPTPIQVKLDPTQINQTLYIPCGDYSVLRHTAFYKEELEKCDIKNYQAPTEGTTTTKPITTEKTYWWIIVSVLVIIIILNLFYTNHWWIIVFVLVVIVVIIIIIGVLVVKFRRRRGIERDRHDTLSDQEQGIPLTDTKNDPRA